MHSTSIIFTLLSLFTLSLSTKPNKHDKRSNRYLSERAAVTPSTVPYVGTTCPANKVLGQYFPDWITETSTQLDWKSIDLAFYFVLETSATGITVPAADIPLMKAMVKAAHAQSKKAILSLGGWDGSVYFSDLVLPANQAAFVKTVTGIMNLYSFDGLDFDWEAPNEAGAGNHFLPADSANFLSFLQLLRKSVGGSKILHAAVPTEVFNGPKGIPLTDVSAFGLVLDYITIMAYDEAGNSWGKKTGANSALDVCTGGKGGAVQAVNNWVNAKFPKCKILLGLPTYSISFTTASNKLTKSTTNGVATVMFQKMATTQVKDPGYTYNELITKKKYLSSNGLTGLNGFTRYFDPCTSTPILFSTSTSTFISYDDLQSTNIKTQFAHDQNLAGVNFFEASGFTNNIYDSAKTILLS